MEDRPDLRRLEPLTGEVGARHVVVRVDRLRYGADPLHEGTELVRAVLGSGHAGVPRAPDRGVEQVRTGPRIGFAGGPIPEPRGALTGLDSGGNGGTGFPSATLR